MNSIRGGQKIHVFGVGIKTSVTWVHCVGFGSNLVEDMGSVCQCCPVNMSSIGGGSRFGGDSKVYKCSLSRNQSITQTSVIGFG